MTVFRLIQLVVATCLVHLGCLAAGFDAAGALLGLILQGLLVGSPVALIANRHLRATSVAVAMAVVVSLAVSGLAAQSLAWFSAANRFLVPVASTAYGVGLAILLVDAGPGPARRP